MPLPTGVQVSRKELREDDLRPTSREEGQVSRKELRVLIFMLTIIGPL